MILIPTVTIRSIYAGINDVDGDKKFFVLTKIIQGEKITEEIDKSFYTYKEAKNYIDNLEREAAEEEYQQMIDEMKDSVVGSEGDR